MTEEKIPSPYDRYSIDGTTAVLYAGEKCARLEHRFNLTSLENRIANLEANPGHEGRIHDTSLEHRALRDLKKHLGL